MDARVRVFSPVFDGQARARQSHEEGRMAFAIRAALAAVVISIVGLPLSLFAQDWPRQPIRIVVGFGAGGGTDIAARIVAQPLSELLGQPVVVENRVGGGGTTAAEAVARAPKDGYTALMMSNAHAVWAAVYKNLRYDPIADFQM